MSNTSETRAAIESGEYKLQYAVYPPVLAPSLWLDCLSFYRHEDLIFFAITERSFPKELAAMYLDDVSAEFLSTHRDTEYRSPALRPYAFNDFDTFMQRTKKSYENPRASNNLDKVQAQLKETTQIMSKNLEDLLYRGDSLDRMGQMSSDLRESSKKYKRAAVRINWELLLKQVCEDPQRVSRPLFTDDHSTVPLLLSARSSCSSSSGASGEWLRQ
jgi:vesicle transport protein SEC22